MSFSAHIDWILSHEEFVHRANRIFGGRSQVITERAKSYEQAREVLFGLAKEAYGHYPAGLRLRKSIEGLGRLLEQLRAEEQTDLVVDHIGLVERVRAELLDLVAGKRRSP